MPGYYTYLISSLPMLHFGRKPPFSSERFFQMCQGVIPDKDINTLKTARQISESIHEDAHHTQKKWHAFDIALRNELAKVRAARKRLDALKYIRNDGYVEPSITHIALHASRTPSIIEAEKILDEERWRVLDELTVGHYFDMGFLIAYINKLLILERWEKVNTADKPRELEKVLS